MYVPSQGDTSSPDIHLKGKWLWEVGVETGELKNSREYFLSRLFF
jgi:hypothetical protein